MRGSDKTSGSLFSYVDLEDRVPTGRPLRAIRAIVNDALAALNADLARLYDGRGRAPIAPERLPTRRAAAAAKAVFLQSRITGAACHYSSQHSSQRRCSGRVC